MHALSRLYFEREAAHRARSSRFPISSRRDIGSGVMLHDTNILPISLSRRRHHVLNEFLDYISLMSHWRRRYFRLRFILSCRCCSSH